MLLVIRISTLKVMNTVEYIMSSKKCKTCALATVLLSITYFQKFFYFNDYTKFGTLLTFVIVKESVSCSQGHIQGVCLAAMTDPFTPQVLSIKADEISNIVTADL